MRAARRRLAVDMSTSSAARAVATTARPTAHAHAHTVSTAPANTSAAAGTTDAPFPVIGAAFTGLSVAALLLLCCVAYCLRPPRKPQAPHGEGHGGGGGGGGQPPEPAGGGAHGDAEHVRVVRLAASDLSQHASSVLGGGGATVAAGSPRPWTRGHNADMSDHVTRQRRPGSLSEMDVALPPATPVRTSAHASDCTRQPHAMRQRACVRARVRVCACVRARVVDTHACDRANPAPLLPCPLRSRTR